MRHKRVPGGGARALAQLVVGNKLDRTHREVPTEEGAEWARSHGMMFLESSAKTTAGIDSVFEDLIRKVLESPSLLACTAAPPTRCIRLAPVDDPRRRHRERVTCCSTTT